MGEEAICLLSDVNMADKTHLRSDLKRSHECVVDSTEPENNRNKKLAVESLIDLNRAHECVEDGTEVENESLIDNRLFTNKNEDSSPKVEINRFSIENLNKELLSESLNDEEKSNKELAIDCGALSRSSECVLDASAVEVSDRKLEKEILNDDSLSRIDLNRLQECVPDATKAENTNKEPVINSSDNDEKSSRVDLNCLSECVLDDMDIEAPNKEVASSDASSRIGLNRLDECIVDATEPDNFNKETGLESSSDGNLSRVELKWPLECAVDVTEVENPNKKPETESSVDESFPLVESKCSNECVLDSIKEEAPNKDPILKFPKVEISAGVELKYTNECAVDSNKAETPNNKQSFESCSDEKSPSIEHKYPNECVLDDIKVENLNKGPQIEFSNDESAPGVKVKDSNECVVDATIVETPNTKPAILSLNDENSRGAELKYSNGCVVDAIKADTPSTKSAIESSNDESSLGVEVKCSNEHDADAMEAETHDKKPVKESSIGSCSEVLNLTLSPQENTSSSQTVSSRPIEGLSIGCGDITPSSAGDSSVEIVDMEGEGINDLSTSLSKSEVILEGSKFGSTSGVKKVIFKINKREIIVDGHPSGMEVENDFSYTSLHEESNKKPLEKIFEDMLEMCTKNVKKLLSTGVLEGVEVKYIKHEKELIRGIIKDFGYLCGCALCNFSKVLSAYEFEQHAGCKTKHPNDCVFLNNGKSLHSIVQELKKTPVSSLERMIRALVGSLFNEDSYREWKESLGTNNVQKILKKGEKDEQSQLNHVVFPPSTTSYSTEDTEDSLDCASRSTMQKFHTKQKISPLQGITKRSKWAPKKLPKSMNNNTSSHVKKRDNDLHRVLFMPNGLPDGAELAYYVKGQKLLDGYKQGNGIVCSCRDSEISPSQFEAHAGWSSKRQPYRHIYTSNGVSLHDLSVSLANGQCLAISNSGDMCSVCGVGSDLIFCDACSQAFHAACLELQCIPEGTWCCPSCKDKVGISGKVASGESSGGARPITIRLVIKPPASEIGGCVVCRAPDFSVLKFDERTVIICDQCEKEYHVGCLRKRGLCDLKELPKGKWFCCESCSRIHATLQNLIFTEAKVIPASMSNTINRKLIQKGLTFEVGNDVQWKLLSGKFGSLEHRSLLSRAVAIFQDSFEPIIERSGHDLIPAMVYGRNIAGQEFGGLYCSVISVKSVIVSAGLLRIFGREVAELPLVATTKGSQEKGYFQALFSCIERLLCFLNIEKLVLPAAEEAESIWTRKFGFRRMPHDQFWKYTRDVQLISFNGTLMLEKELSQGL